MKDQIIKFLAYNGKISVVCCSTTNLVEEARKYIKSVGGFEKFAEWGLF